MSLDFFTTEFVAQGDISMEGNKIAVWWWNVTGTFRHIGIPIWLVYVFGIAYLLNMKSEFFALWWLNGLAFGHLIGWLSWSSYYRILDFLYTTIRNEWALTFALSGLGMFIGLLFSICQIKLGKKNKLEIV